MYENILAIGDFNLSVGNSHLEAFMQAYDFSSLINKPTYCQSNTPSKLVCTILKSGGFKGAPIEKIYRSYKTFDVNLMAFLVHKNEKL